MTLKSASMAILGALAVFLMVLGLSGCPNAYTVATKTTAGVMYATQATSRGYAAYAEARIAAGEDRPPICKGLALYRDNVRPAARSSVAAAYAGIRIAQEAGKKDYDYLTVLKPGACALLIGLREWAHKMPDGGMAIMGYLSVFSGVVCDKVDGKVDSALAIIAALLPVAVDLVRWIISVVGSSDDALMKTINAWILGPSADEVDALIAKSCAGAI